MKLKKKKLSSFVSLLYSAASRAVVSERLSH